MVSIIITAYNVSHYIEQAITSCLTQTHTDIEVIVVLDCPTDNTADIVWSIAATDSRVRVIENEKNVGAGLSRRAGLQAAKGEYTLLLDGDDYLANGFVEDLYAKAVETGADIVSGGITVLQEDGVRNITLYGDVTTEGYDKVTRFWGERVVFMNNKLIRRELHEKVPYCHRRYIEDTPVIIPQLWYANRVVYVDNAGYIYRMNSNSLTHTADEMKNLIFRGLCWCDLMDFFNTNDPDFFNHFPLKNFVAKTLEVLNNIPIEASRIAPYANEWAEFTMRLFKLVKVTGIDFKQINTNNKINYHGNKTV